MFEARTDTYFDLRVVGRSHAIERAYGELRKAKKHPELPSDEGNKFLLTRDGVKASSSRTAQQLHPPCMILPAKYAMFQALMASGIAGCSSAELRPLFRIGEDI